MKSLMILPADRQADVKKILTPLIQTLEKEKKQVIRLPLISSGDEDAVQTACTLSGLEKALAEGQSSFLTERVVRFCEDHRQNTDLILVEGISDSVTPYAAWLNKTTAEALDAEIVLFASADQGDFSGIEIQVSMAAQFYGSRRVIGFILDPLSAATQCGGDGKNNSVSCCTKRFEGSTVPFLGCFVKSVFKVKQEDFYAKILSGQPLRITSALFNYQLIYLAKQANKTIVLPEGEEPRTIKAAKLCADRKIARCVLLGNPKVITKVAKEQQVELGEGVTVIDPETIFSRYIDPMVELRKHKGMTREEAEKTLKESTVFLGTMMLKRGDVDGLVSGAIHTTAHTVRPALQLIKTREGMSIVSSLFFMCLPEEVLIYADCAINPNPTAAELAEIAIQTAQSAIQFGFEPRVALLSYSTMNSGEGPDVDTVREAVLLAKQKNPELLIDGPLQYDAAVNLEVAKLKAPRSSVAGRANVFIFPDLNTGNIVYKAVQRTNRILCFGPMLQGLRKPVNDLSRGCSSEDIVYTIALTAIQAR